MTGQASPAPLADVRIIAVEQYGAGPFGTLLLADLGADVIKIEDARSGGDVGRYVPPFQEDEDSLFFETFNRNKRSVSLDLATPAGRGVLGELIAASDCVYSNLRGDLPERLGLRYDDLKDRNPRIVCCSLSGFGTTGPRREQPAYDYILQGLCGWMDLTGEPGGPPTKSGLSLVDFCGGLTAALSVVAGVHAARRDGRGMDCDLGLFDVGLGLLTYLATWRVTGDWQPRRHAHSAHPSLVPFQNFRTSDGWIVVGCAKEKFWRRLVEVLGRPELAADPRFARFADRDEHRDELLEVLAGALVEHGTHHWVAALTAAGVPCGPVNTLAQALEEPIVAARGLLVETEHPRFGTVRAPASPARVGPPRREHRRAPARHEDAEAVLGGLLGYDEERLRALEGQGAFGAPA